jgi:hypothetical protein
MREIITGNYYGKTIREKITGKNLEIIREIITGNNYGK